MVPSSLFRRNPFYVNIEVWDPFQEFHRHGPGAFVAASCQAFADAASSRQAFADAATQLVLAGVDWKETREAYVLKADLPGFKNNEVKVEVERGNILRVTGEKCVEKEEMTNRWYYLKRSSGKFLRRFRLPDNTKAEKMKASVENGILTVTVPKRAPETFKSIRISGN